MFIHTVFVVVKRKDDCSFSVSHLLPSGMYKEEEEESFLVKTAKPSITQVFY